MAERGLVVLSQRLGPVTQDERRIEEAGHGTVVSSPLWTVDDIRTHAAAADAVIAGAVEPFDAEAIAALGRCRAIVRRGVGYDNVDVAAATAAGIVVANVTDASVEEVSDHALAMLLSLERRLPALDRLVHEGRWRHDPGAIAAERAPIRRLRELTLGIVGFGRIGRAMARKSAGVYGRILAHDPYVDPGAGAAHSVELVGLDELLHAADHVTLHVALTGGSRRLLDAAALGRMRPGAILVNTARGGVVDESALLDALRAGALGGAGLDVTEREPLPPDSPLPHQDGLLLTGHSAVASTTAQRDLARRSVDAVLAVLDGRLPDSVVNPEVLDSPAVRLRGRAGPAPSVV